MPNRLLTWLWGRLPFRPRTKGRIVWLLSPKFVVGVVAFLRNEEGRVLLLKHTYRPGREWGLPGGGLHHGERLEECLHREVREEAGLEVEIDSLLSASAHPERKLVDMIFACHPLPGQSLAGFRPNAEISEARYFPLDALPEELPESQRKLIQVALRQSGGDKRIQIS